MQYASNYEGMINYVGQLEDDLVDLLRAVDITKPATYTGLFFLNAGG